LVNRSARSLALKDRGTAEAWLEQGKADLIAFGCKFLANPDLPDRFRAQANRKPAWTIDGDSTQRPIWPATSLAVELTEKYGRSAATGIASAQNLTHLKRR
jgi:2,4-dienoyl-CoA reductase-like NADH-dependent reductase (Old Yellow Enzyme family)